MTLQGNLISVMEPKRRPKSRGKNFQYDSTTPEKNASSYDSMKRRSLHSDPADHVFASSAKFGGETYLESLPTPPASASSTASSQQSDSWDTPEQKGSISNYPSTPLTPPTPLTSPISFAYGKQRFEPPSPTPTDRSELLPTTKAQLSIYAQELVRNTKNQASTTGSGSHNDVSTEEATEAGSVYNRPSLKNSNPSSLKQPVQRRLFQQQPGLQGQEAFEGANVLVKTKSPVVTLKDKTPPKEGSRLQQQVAYSKSSEFLDGKENIKVPPVTPKANQSGRSNTPPEEGAYSKSSEFLDVKDNIEVPSVTPKATQSGRSNRLRQESSGLGQPRAHIKDSTGGLSSQDGTESSSSDQVTEESGFENSLQQELTAAPKSEAYTQAFQSQRQEFQSQERDLTMKKTSEPRKRNEFRSQEPENTGSGINSRAEAITTGDRTYPRSSSLLIDEKTLHDLLNLRTHKCVGIRTTKIECNSLVKRCLWAENLERLQKNISVEAILSSETLSQVVENLLCYHHKKQASEVLSKWTTSFQKWIGSGGLNFSSNPDGPRTRSQLKDQTVGPTKEIAVLECFTRIFQPFSRIQKNIRAHLLKVMSNELSDPDKKPGLIYIYWIPGNRQIPDGLVKIGVTNTETTERRIKLWKRCHPDLDCTKSPDFPKFPHAKRIEKLIHADLKIFQHRQIGCSRCTSDSHKELFAVPLQVAIKATVSWMKWACRQPYNEDGLIRRECIPVELYKCGLGPIEWAD